MEIWAQSQSGAPGEIKIRFQFHTKSIKADFRFGLEDDGPKGDVWNSHFRAPIASRVVDLAATFHAGFPTEVLVAALLVDVDVNSLGRRAEFKFSVALDGLDVR
jgi:hypothetical protein